jgi:hypothetical protein
LPTGSCLSRDPGIYQSDDNILSGHSKEIAAGNNELNSTSRLAPSECVEHIFSDILPPRSSNWDYRVDVQDEFSSCDVSPVPMSDPWTGMVCLSYSISFAFINDHSFPKSETEYPVPHENLIDLDDDLDAPSGPCTFDDAEGDDVMLLDFD